MVKFQTDDQFDHLKISSIEVVENLMEFGKLIYVLNMIVRWTMN